MGFPGAEEGSDWSPLVRVREEIRGEGGIWGPLLRLREEVGFLCG